jgi:DNA-binding transcriptional ArsR family regulator
MSKMDVYLHALSDVTRRDIFEQIVIRPRRIGELSDGLPVSRSAVSHHVKILRDSGLVQCLHDRIEVVVDVLPEIRMYFDRLWLEATLGDTWIRNRTAENSDLGY